MTVSIVKVVFDDLNGILTSEEEQMLRGLAEQNDATRIDGLQVYWITSETISDYLSPDFEPINPHDRVVLESLHKKLTAHFGDDFYAFDFITE